MKTKGFLKKFKCWFLPNCLFLIVFYSCFIFSLSRLCCAISSHRGTGEVTFAIALLLIDIIEDCNLHVKTSLPVALLRVDKILSQVTAPGSIKRACLNRVKYGQELHERMDMLYTSSEDEIGPVCTKMGINKKWLRDHHQYDLEPGMIVTNGAILELYQYIKNTNDLNWADGVRCLARFYPDKEHELPVAKWWQSKWNCLQAKRNSKKYGAKKTLRDEWLMEEYHLSNRATLAACVDNIVTEDDPRLKDDGVDETTGVQWLFSQTIRLSN